MTIVQNTANNTTKSVDNSVKSGIIEKEKIVSAHKYAVKQGLTTSRAFVNKFSLMTEDKTLQREFYGESKAMLKNRSGTNGEDLKYYNPRLKKWYRSTKGTEAGSPEYNEEILLGLEEAKENEIIAFHNHPAGMPPSSSDLNAALNNKYAKAYTIGHNGKIFEYTAPVLEIPEYTYNSRIAKHLKEGLSEYEAQIAALNDLKEIYNFSYREVK